MSFRADFDLDLDLWTVKNRRGEIEARCPDRRTAEDIAHAMSLNSAPQPSMSQFVSRPDFERARAMAWRL